MIAPTIHEAHRRETTSRSESRVWNPSTDQERGAHRHNDVREDHSSLGLFATRAALTASETPD